MNQGGGLFLVLKTTNRMKIFVIDPFHNVSRQIQDQVCDVKKEVPEKPYFRNKQMKIIFLLKLVKQD